jgi:WD repeat-containing protein 68
LEHSTVLYETDNNPLLKLAWNKLDSNYLAVLEMDDKNVTLIDIRYFILFIYIYIYIYIYIFLK